MQLTACEPLTMSTAGVMDPSGDVLQSCGTGDSIASLDDPTVEPTVNESSEEETACEREEESPAAQRSTDMQSASAQRPASLSLPVSGSALWTMQREGEVKLRMGDSGPAAVPPVTVHQAFTRTVKRFGSYTALGWKDGEQWKKYSYTEYYQACRTAAKSFLKLGLERFHGVGILGFNSPEWFIADIGAIFAGNGSVSRNPLNYRLAKRLVFRKVRKALGLDRCRQCFTGAAPITKETLEFFLSLDIPLYELYGMSESSGPHTISLPEAFRLTSCGKVMTGCQTKIFSPDEEGNGEICFWGRHVFMGYLNMPEKTDEALDADGWLRSGDLGKHDENDFLFITGRIKELIITAGGENIPPVLIEDAVKAAVPLISNAMLIGDKRKFLSMLLTIKCQVNADTGAPEDELTPDALEFCQKLGSTSTRVSEIAGGRDRLIHTAIQEGINSVNEKATSNAQRIQKFTVLEQDFSIPGGELGPTMKLKRPVVTKMYKEQIENFYREVMTPNTPGQPSAF
ncbi:hypothetical protein SRHO_G00325880 [Serrasalmus rhombeus]